jgi:WD40 repeat protein
LTEWVLAVAFSPDGRTLAIGRGDRNAQGIDTGSVQLWDTQTLTKTSEPLGYSSDFILSIAFNTDGSILAGTGPEGTVHLWDARVKTQQDAFSADAGHLHAVAFDPADSQTFAAAANDGEVLVWKIGHAAFGAPTAGADAGRERVTYSGGDTIRLSGPHARTIAGAGRVARVSLSDNGDWVAAFAPDGFVRVWSTASGGLIARIATGQITALAVDDKGQKLATGVGSGAVRLWDVRTQRLIHPVLRGHSAEVRAIAFSPTQTTLATGGADSATYLWDVRTHRKLAALRLGQQISSLAFSPDGRLLATGQDDGVRLWDARAHTLLADRFGGSARYVAFSSDGQRLVSEDATGDRSTHVWDGILWSTNADLRRQVCDLVFPGITRSEWNELAPNVKYRKSCP